MSKYLVKQMFAVEAKETRLIDTNGLLRRRSQSAEMPWEGQETAGETQHKERETKPQETQEQPDAALFLEQAREQARTLLEEAREEAAGLVESARAQAEQEKKSLLEQARRQGYQEGQAQAQAEAAKLQKELKEKMAQAQEDYRQQVAEIEPKLVDTITAVYEQIFKVDLSSRRDILEHLISKALHLIEGGHSYLIHVSREDYPYISAQKEQMLAGAVSEQDTVDVVEDMTLGENQCLIETQTGIFDCGLGTQMTELRRKLKLLSWSGEE